MRVLIAYATEHGSTKEVAQRIGDQLSMRGIESDCHPVNLVDNVNSYSYAIIGSAVHNVKWLPKAMAFLKAYEKDLKEIPVWAYSVGYTVGMPRIVRDSYQESEVRDLRNAIKQYISVRDHKLFNGRLLREHTGTVFTVMYRGTGGSFGDSIDWAAIERWADGIAEAIRNGE